MSHEITRLTFSFFVNLILTTVYTTTLLFDIHSFDLYFEHEMFTIEYCYLYTFDIMRDSFPNSFNIEQHYIVIMIIHLKWLYAIYY